MTMRYVIHAIHTVALLKQFQTSAAHLPMFNEFGDHRVPMSRADVPFDQCMHAVFTVDLFHDESDGRQYVLANCVSILKA